jgi:hypothetical protein
MSTINASTSSQLIFIVFLDFRPQNTNVSRCLDQHYRPIVVSGS